LVLTINPISQCLAVLAGVCAEHEHRMGFPALTVPCWKSRMKICGEKSETSACKKESTPGKKVIA
jgi:hypothetical protein